MLGQCKLLPWGNSRKYGGMGRIKFGESYEIHSWFAFHLPSTDHFGIVSREGMVGLLTGEPGLPAILRAMS